MVQAAAFILPVLAGVVAAVGINLLLPVPTTTAASIAWWAIFVAGVGGSALYISRLARRLLPLATLLRLTLTFPDNAPSRLAVARAAGRTRDLKKRVAHAQEEGWEAGSFEEAASTLLALVAALTAHDRGTRGHSERVRTIVDLLAEEMHIAPDDRERLRWAALLHDIGKLEVDSEILNKPGKPDKQEWAQLQKHPHAGMTIAGPLLPWLGSWAGAIRDHHERYDGSGYPNGVSGGDISLGGRILAVADSFETMTATRAYKKPMTPQAARRELVRCSGAQFDPFVVRHLLNASVGKLWWLVGIGAALVQVPLVGALANHGITQKVGRQTSVAAGVGLSVVSLTMAGALNLAPLSTTGEATPAGDAVAQEAAGPAESADPSEPTSSSRPATTPAREDIGPSRGDAIVPPGDDSPSSDEPGKEREDEPPPDPVSFTRYGRIRLFFPLYPDQHGVTQREFLRDCAVPSSQGVDGWVFQLPPEVGDRRAAFSVVADSPVGPEDVDVQLYSEDCRQLMSVSAGHDAAGTSPIGARFMFAGLAGGVDALITLRF